MLLSSERRGGGVKHSSMEGHVGERAQFRGLRLIANAIVLIRYQDLNVKKVALQPDGASKRGIQAEMGIYRMCPCCL